MYYLLIISSTDSREGYPEPYRQMYLQFTDYTADFINYIIFVEAVG
jgi:hypothetical protein